MDYPLGKVERLVRHTGADIRLPGGIFLEGDLRESLSLFHVSISFAIDPFVFARCGVRFLGHSHGADPRRCDVESLLRKRDQKGSEPNKWAD